MTELCDNRIKCTSYAILHTMNLIDRQIRWTFAVMQTDQSMDFDRVKTRNLSLFKQVFATELEKGSKTGVSLHKPLKNPNFWFCIFAVTRIK